MLNGEHIILRAFSESDIPFINSWRNDLRNKILTQGFRLPVNMDMDKKWISEKVITKDDRNVYFIVAEKQNNTPIGIIQLNNIDYISGTAIWGFILGNIQERGKGYEVEAPRLLLKYAFNVLNLRILTSYTLSIRPGIQKLHKKVGKVREEGILKGHYFYNGIYYDIHILSFFKEDYPDLKYDNFR
jgi:RimJ/RimL family protein N-acetyltransferase